MNTYDCRLRRAAVTGLGAISSLGLDVPSMWSAMIEGKSGIDYISSFDTSNFEVKIAAEVRGFDMTAWVTRKQAQRMDRFTRFAVAASLQAVENARLTIDDRNSEGAGVIIGNSVCGLVSVLEQMEVLANEGPDRISPILAPTMSGDAAGVQVSLLLGTRGINYSPSSACSSASDAIGQGFDLIQRGLAKIVIAGGTEAPLLPIVVAAFNQIRALSRRNDNPKAACRPFDAGRDGLVLGEGAGILLMEDMETALERGAPILAEVVGYGCTSDAFHLTAPSPDGISASRALNMALERADVAASDVGYINAHGTATLLNDRTETNVIKNVFGEAAYGIPVSASKSQLGHLIGAAGGIEAVVTVLALHHGILPPTINLTDPDPECDLDYVPNHARKSDIQVAVSNSFGFGGHNSVLVFRRP